MQGTKKRVGVRQDRKESGKAPDKGTSQADRHQVLSPEPPPAHMIKGKQFTVANPCGGGRSQEPAKTRSVRGGGKVIQRLTPKLIIVKTDSTCRERTAGEQEGRDRIYCHRIQELETYKVPRTNWQVHNSLASSPASPGCAPSPLSQRRQWPALHLSLPE